MPAEREDAWSVPLQTAGLVLAYMVARHLIYAAMPAPDPLTGAWLRRDLVMTAPRLAALTGCLALVHRRGGFRRWGWTWQATTAGAMLGALIAAQEAFAHLSFGTLSVFSSRQILWGWASTVPVALFEEAAFRSLLFLALRRRTTPLKAALASSLLFLLFHYEAWPLADGIHIFLFGLGACAALHAGLGLGWLVAAHLLADGLWFQWNAGDRMAGALFLSRAAGLALLIAAPLFLDADPPADLADNPAAPPPSHPPSLAS